MSRADRALVDRFWRATPLAALWPLLVAVFATFGCFGFLIDVARGGRHPWPALVCLVAASGLIAVAYVLIAVRQRYWLFVPAIAVEIGFVRWLDSFWPPLAGGLSGDALRARLVLDAGGAVAGLVCGYVFFMMFIVRQGLRRVRAEAEMALAREIHVSLVPALSFEDPACQMYGRSIPASEVGGDLVDALLVAGRPLGFVADVSGHGVPAGSLMGLLKSGLRTRLRAPGDLGAVLGDLNEVLCDLTRPNTFATAAVLQLETPSRLAWALAGHPPILHLRRAGGSPARLAQGGMALGIRSGERYAVGRVEVGPGDLLAVFTDGLSETMDRADRELGIEPLAAALVAHAAAPLPELFDRLIELANAHGPQQDDRTLLLVRVGGSQPAGPRVPTDPASFAAAP